MDVAQYLNIPLPYAKVLTNSIVIEASLWAIKLFTTHDQFKDPISQFTFRDLPLEFYYQVLDMMPALTLARLVFRKHRHLIEPTVTESHIDDFLDQMSYDEPQLERYVDMVRTNLIGVEIIMTNY
jgi:hypothetical protein